MLEGDRVGGEDKLWSEGRLCGQHWCLEGFGPRRDIRLETTVTLECDDVCTPVPAFGE